MNDRALLSLMSAMLCAHDWRESDAAVKQARAILSEIDKSPAPEAGSGSTDKDYRNPTRCRSAMDGDCSWSECPQTRDGEPAKTGRHCPLDVQPAPPARAETPTVEECVDLWKRTYDAEDGTHGEAMRAGVTAVRALCLTSRPEGMDAAKLIPIDAEKFLADMDLLADIRGHAHFGSVTRATIRCVLSKYGAPPLVARETTSGIDRRVLGSALQHIDEARADVAALLDAARQLSPSGEEKSVDVPALIEFMHENYGWNPDGDADLWARELTAALKEQGIPTRAPKVDGGGV